MAKQLTLFADSVLTPYTELDSTIKAALKCQRCELAVTRNCVVFGKGNTHEPPVMFVGEGPGAEEDKKGEPFIGRAGRKLDDLLVRVGWQRANMYITNCVKCRPPDNRVPTATEIAACGIYLVRELNIIRPKVICLLGMTAAKTVLGTTAKALSTLRGKSHTWRDTPVRVTYHPAYLLRSPEKEGEFIDDMKQIQAILSRNASS